MILLKWYVAMCIDDSPSSGGTSYGFIKGELYIVREKNKDHVIVKELDSDFGFLRTRFKTVAIELCKKYNMLIGK